MVYMRNNNNFRNQNRQIHNDSNNENNDELEMRKKIIVIKLLKGH